MDSPVVTLNVGGTHFTTTQETLHKEPSSKLSLTVRGILPSATDDGGHTFLDRDARFFQLILNFLRDGWVLLPESPSERRELVQEARYYQLNNFESWLRTQELLGAKSDAIARSPGDPGAAHVTPPSTPPPKAAPPPPAMSPQYPSTPTNSPPRAYKSFSSPSFSPTRAATDTLRTYAATPPLATRASNCAACCPCTSPASIPRICVPPPADDGFRWTAKYLRTNPKIREVVDTLLELAFMPPNRALTMGRVHVSIVAAPENGAYLSNKSLAVKVTGALGWSFEFTVRPTCDYCLFQKYNVAEYVQDNWFVLSAILKDQYGVCMEEACCGRHASVLARRQSMHIALSKPCCC